MCVKAGGGHFEHYFWFRHCVFSNNYLLSLISWTLARKWIGRFGSIAVVSYDFALCFGHCLVHKVKQRHWLGEENLCCVSIFALVMIFLAKNHTIYLNCQSYVRTWLAETAFFNDVTTMSSLRSVVQVLIRKFTVFQSHRLSGWFVLKIVKSCRHLSKLWPKYYQSLFFWDTVYMKMQSHQL